MPVKLRKELGVEKGDEVIGWVEEGRLVLEPRAALIARMRAKYAVKSEGSLVDGFIAERRAEAEKEWAELENDT